MKDLISATDLAKYLTIDKWELNRLKNMEHFPREINHSWKKRFFNKSEIERWLAKCLEFDLPRNTKRTLEEFLILRNSKLDEE